MNQEELKRLVGRAAVEYVRPGEVLGVGTGSTANCFIDALAEALSGRIPGTVASSEATTERLRGHGFEVLDMADIDRISVYVDGADELDPSRALIKGGGGALTREKIVASAADQFVCIVDASKRVDVLGNFPLPIEIIPMAGAVLTKRLKALGGRAELRGGFVTDNGNHILDVHGLSITDPVDLEREIEAWPGVVTCGLFAARGADVVLMGTEDGVQRL
jgi:ribose 5-phosphate isomerase A